MEIVIEIGTSQQKELINNELEAIFRLIPEIDSNLRVHKVIVPNDFDVTINGLIGKSNYRSVRNFGENQVTTQAKFVNTPDGFCVVISSHIFNEQQDLQTRCFIYIHELIHLVNRTRLNSGENHSKSDSIYTHNLETFVDEYIADRKAYSIIDKVFPIKSNLWQSDIERQASDYAVVLADQRLMKTVKNLIQQVQVHKDIVRFLDDISPMFDGVFLSLAHSFSLSDCFPTELPLSTLTKSQFVNEKTIALVDYARQMYLDDDSTLSEGLPIIRDFMQNFGITFYDSPQGLVCHVDY